MAENTAAVTTVAATDADAGSALTYTITGGADAARFTINATTGVVTVADAPPSTSVPGLHGGGDPGADDAIPEETEAVAPARRPRRPARGRGMQQQIVLQAATWMAGEVGDALPPKLWPDFLEALRRELGVTDVELVAARDVQDPGSTD